MTSTKRLVKESPVGQGKNERVAYEFGWSRLGTPANPSVYLLDSDGEDVSAVHLFGSATVDGNTVTTPLVILLTPRSRYRLVCRAEVDGNTLEAICEIVGED